MLKKVFDLLLTNINIYNLRVTNYMKCVNDHPEDKKHIDCLMDRMDLQYKKLIGMKQMYHITTGNEIVFIHTNNNFYSHIEAVSHYDFKGEVESINKMYSLEDMKNYKD